MEMGKKIVIALLISGLLSAAACSRKVERLEWINGEGAGYDVSAPVQIIRDKYGVPHIKAENDVDLFYALGYSMAQDRYFYLDLMRRLAKGDILGLIGNIPSYKSYDLVSMMKIIRALDYEGQAKAGIENMDKDDLELLVAFTSGMNRYLDDAGHTIPQYQFFKTVPEEWRPEDSLACAMFFGLTMTWSSFSYEYYYTRLAREIGHEKARLFLHDYPEDAPTAVEDYAPLARNEQILDKAFSMLGFAGNLWTSPGSNNWVVSGQKSESGKPILCNDPHVPTIILTFWYHVHLEGGSFNAMGLMFPGLPVFGTGTNGTISWGITNARVDYMDMVRERINPADPDQYWYEGDWRPFRVVRGDMPVRGKKPIPYEVRYSEHGPVIDENLTGWPVPTDAADEVYSLRFLDMQLERFFHGYLNIARAKDWKTFTAALKDKARGPVAWNHVYADVHGNTGYYLSGLVPLRKDNQGIYARKGWEKDDEWQGYVPFEELPHIFNPKKGFIATANNKNTPEDYPYYVSASYDVPSRAARITEVLKGKDVLGIEDMKELQYDHAVMSARRFVPVIINDLDNDPDEKIQIAVRELETWREGNYVAEVNSIGTSIYKAFIPRFSRAIFLDDVGKLIMSRFGFTGMDKFALPKIIDEPDSIWYDDSATPKRECRADIARRAMLEAIADLEKKAGKNPDSWKWGNLQTAYIYSPVGFVPFFGRDHRIGRYPHGGTDETVDNAVSFFVPFFKYVYLAGPSSRFIVDMSDPACAYFNSNTGNSENIKSGRMGNMTEYWVHGRYARMSMNQEDYEREAMGKLILKP